MWHSGMCSSPTVDTSSLEDNSVSVNQQRTSLYRYLIRLILAAMAWNSVWANLSCTTLTVVKTCLLCCKFSSGRVEGYYEQFMFPKLFS